MDFINKKDLGIDKEYVVAVNGLTSKTIKSYDVIKQKLLGNTGINNVCLAQGITAERLSGQYMGIAGDSINQEIPVNQTRTTLDFIKTFGISLVAGRDFSADRPTDKENFIINEAAVKALGLQGDVIGKQITMNSTGFIIGVVKNYHYASLHNAIESLIITLNDLKRGIIYVKMESQNIQRNLDLITRTIQSADPVYTPDYEFLDDTFNSMYEQDKRISRMLFSATILAIMLALAGLVALTSLSIIRRTKEIGIRKVNGADVSEVMMMLNMNFLRWVLLAYVIATPVAWLAMQKWMERFAFKTNMSWWIFMLSGLIVIGIALLTISWQSWRAATRNPVESLRYE
jgi:putative ABC transport system permease protein